MRGHSLDMRTRKALLVGSAARLKSLAGILAHQHFTVERTEQDALGELGRLTAQTHFDLVLVDLNVPQSSGVQFVKCLKERGDVPLVFVGDEKLFERHASGLAELLVARDVDWVRTPVGDAEFGLRINKVAPRVTPGLSTWSIPELRSNKSGRLDAAKVAVHFGWSLTKLSTALHRSVQAVHKTPDAPTIQKRLEQLERVALLARRVLAPERSEFLKWLNTPSPDLDGEKPGELLLEKATVVVEWLEDALSGQPA